MALPHIIEDIEARVKDTGDVMSGSLFIDGTIPKQNLSLKITGFGGSGYSQFYKNCSDTTDYGTQLIDVGNSGNNTRIIIRGQDIANMDQLAQITTYNAITTTTNYYPILHKGNFTSYSIDKNFTVHMLGDVNTSSNIGKYSSIFRTTSTNCDGVAPSTYATITRFRSNTTGSYDMWLSHDSSGNFYHFRTVDGALVATSNWRMILDKVNYSANITFLTKDLKIQTASNTALRIENTGSTHQSILQCVDTPITQLLHYETQAGYNGIYINGPSSSTKENFLRCIYRTNSTNNIFTILHTGNISSYLQPRYRYRTTSSGIGGYHKININSSTAWMTAFTVRLYQAYRYTDLVISGYNYGANYWYSPNVTMLGSTHSDAIPVIFGYDSAWSLWVAIPAGNYFGVEIINVINGYQEFDSYQDLFTITHLNTLTGTAQTTITAQRPWYRGESITGAVWNDYAEYRESDLIEPGYCLIENGDDTLSKSTERMQAWAGISSDTWGFAQGQTEKAQTPIAVAGRVLVYPYRDRNEYKSGDCVCTAPDGKVDIMTEEEIYRHPDKIIGVVSCVPDYEEWGGGENADRPSVKVDGRIWVRVK